MRPRLKMRLGDLLVHENVITELQLSHALEQQRQSGRKLGTVFTDLDYLSEQELNEFLSKQLNIPLVDLSDRRITEAAVKLLPEIQARRHRAIVVEADAEQALVGMSDPADLTAIDAISRLLAPRDVNLCIVANDQLATAYDSLYRRTQDIEQFASQLQDEYKESSEFDLGQLTLDEEGEAATVAKLLQSIFADAIQIRASDIHIEPDADGLRIRQRVDGVLQENILDEANIAAALILRLKLMAGLDISEKRLPQDGRFHMNVSKHSIDVRVSTMPTQHGESCVMRLLDQSAGILTLENTGMPPALLKRIRVLINRPHGMLIVTGPTGSGKTTTLYGVLSELNRAERKIITVEDPVEYRLPRINQVQVNQRIGLSFSQVLRTTLRQDPDIIMVGEMRDQETVEIGLRGSITGHLVLSTLHTNDAITSALRLIDMGAASYLVAAALRGILAQRLIRRICESCKHPVKPDVQELSWLRQMDSGIDETTPFYAGRGCQNCNHTGFKGRVGVFELLELNAAMVDALRDGDTRGFADAAKNSKNYRTLANEALDYAKSGVTTVGEVLFLAETVEEVEALELTAVEDQ